MCAKIEIGRGINLQSDSSQPSVMELTNPIMEVELAELDLRLARLKLPVPQEVDRLAKSINKKGLWQPLDVTTGVEPGKLVLVNGFKRAKALEKLGRTKTTVHLLDLDEVSSLTSMIVQNRARDGLCALEEAWIVHELCRKHNLGQANVGELLERHKTWVCRRLQLAEQLDEEVQNEIRFGLVFPSIARELIRLPRGNQLQAARVVQQHKLTNRQAHEWIAMLSQTDDPEIRRALFDSPLEYLQKEASKPSVSRDPRLSFAGNELRRGFLSLQVSIRQLQIVCQKHAPAGVRPEDTFVLVPMTKQVLNECRDAQRRLERLLSDSQSCRKEEDERGKESVAL